MAYSEEENDERIGNQFWKKRSKHGRDKIFGTPDILKDACYEYFDHQSQQTWDRIDFKGKEVEEVKIPTASPFTLTGLCIFLDVNTNYFTDFEDNIKKGDDPNKNDFSRVITHIREIIYTQKFEGAAVGAYNANIIARDLGLADKTESKSTVKFDSTEEEVDADIKELTEEMAKAAKEKE